MSQRVPPEARQESGSARNGHRRGTKVEPINFEGKAQGPEIRFITTFSNGRYRIELRGPYGASSLGSAVSIRTASHKPQ